MDPASVLGGLDEDQLRAVVSPARPLAVLAPAGSGKTRVLAARIAHRIVAEEADPEHVLCVTFTRRAAIELRERLLAMGIRERIEAGTFHSVAWRQLQDRWAQQGRPAPTLLTRTRPFLQEHLGVERPVAIELEAELAWSRARLVRPDRYEEAAAGAGRRTRQPAARIAEQFAAFERAKTRRHVVDFDDLLAACTAAIDGDAGFAAAQRWRFRHLFVDEFQDVNPLQFRLLETWRGDRWDVFVVGDTHQSIYGWNGAEPRLLQDLGARWPTLETLVLTRTHRSTPQITAAAASVVDAAGLAERRPAATGAPGPTPRLFAHASDTAEIEAIAGLIRRRRSPDTSWRHFAVLTRTQGHVDQLERGLRALGLPTRVHRPVSAESDTAPGSDPYAGHRGPVNGDEVTVSTIHGAKGLEWDVVHVAGCEDGWMPVSSARRRSARDEEARLLYVALTRARTELALHWARERSLGDRRVTRRRSPFLERFEADVAAVGVGPEATAAPDRLREIRTGLSPHPEPDPLLAALRAWRARLARAARTEPEVVLTDEVLTDIARRRPRSVEELGAVPGLGRVRLRRHGDEVVAVVSRHAARS